ncbi:MAG: SAM-dependent methyltransferase, partial [Microbacterium sp.]
TQVLRERGARRVLAVDVGHDQLAAAVLADPGVVSVEGYNVRYMTAENLAESTGEQDAPDLITGDLSFISLAHVFPAIARVAAPGADIVLLIKPQFEVGRTAVKGGLVSDPVARVDAVERTAWDAWDAGLGMRGILPSPILGGHGNAEYLARFGAGGGDPSQWTERIADLAGGR